MSAVFARRTSDSDCSQLEASALPCTGSGGTHAGLVGAAGPVTPAMTCSSVPVPPTPLLARRSGRTLHQALCFLILALQGGALDFYLIAFTDPYWSSWVATDVVVLGGWAIFFLKNSRSKRERACGFRQRRSVFGCGLGEFTYAYLAWLIYVIACAPKLALVLETSILELVQLKVPFGVTGFKVVLMLSAPLLYCLINAVVEDLNGTSRHYSQSCFLQTCLDLLDTFTLLEMLLSDQIPVNYLKYTVLVAHFLALSGPVLWLYELTSSQVSCRWIWAKLLAGLAVNVPLLAVRCLLVYQHGAPVSAFLLKNVFFLGCKCLELLEQCLALKGPPSRSVSHGVSENDMCPHGYVNALAVNAQS